MPGYDKLRIIGMTKEELDEYTCGICQEVINNPVFTQCCRQTYCKACIEEWLISHSTCPNDRKLLRNTDLLPTPRLVINVVNNMRIKCEYQENGCNVTTKIAGISRHLQICEKRPDRFCDKCGEKKDYLGHNCVDNLLLKNQSLMDEMKRLIKEAERDHQANGIYKKNVIFNGAILIILIMISFFLLADSTMLLRMASARANHLNYTIDSSKGLTEEETTCLTNICKQTILDSSNYKEIKDRLSINLKKKCGFNENDVFNIFIYSKDMLSYSIYHKKNFQISFDRVKILIFTSRGN